MNLYHLKYFCDALEEKSLSRAAVLNHVSPGAVSQAIKKLEEFFDTSLLDHKKKQLRPTEKGHHLKVLGESLLSNFEKLRHSMSHSEDMACGEIRFSTQQSIANSFLPKLLKNFKVKYPEIVPHFGLGDTSIVQRDLDSGKINFAIVLDNVGFKDCYEEVLYSGKFVFIKSTGLKTSKLKFITTDLTSEVRFFEKQYKHSCGANPPISMRINSWGVIKRMVKEGHGIGFVPDFILVDEDKADLIKVKIKIPEINYSIKAVWPKSFPMQKRMKLFFEFLKENI